MNVKQFKQSSVVEWTYKLCTYFWDGLVHSIENQDKGIYVSRYQKLHKNKFKKKYIVYYSPYKLDYVPALLGLLLLW